MREVFGETIFLFVYANFGRRLDPKTGGRGDGVLARVTPPKESGGAHITSDAAAVGSDAEQGTA